MYMCNCMLMLNRIFDDLCIICNTKCAVNSAIIIIIKCIFYNHHDSETPIPGYLLSISDIVYIYVITTMMSNVMH